MNEPAAPLPGHRESVHCGVPNVGSTGVLDVPPGRYDWVVLQIEGPAAGSTLWLHYRDGVDPETVPTGTNIRVPVARHDDLVAVRLPLRPGVRVDRVSLLTAFTSTAWEKTG